MSTASAPIEIGRVSLVVRDLAGTAGFYERLLGLSRLSQDGSEVVLGVGGRAILALRADPSAPPRDPAAAGLFHNAFLLPSRAALGRWLRHAAEAGQQLEGASDHLVSEAIYLSDPEGNGIEVYADKPRDVWHGPDGRLKMATLRLDLPAVAQAADRPWTGAPDGTVMGHVHLQVGDAPEAERFFVAALGMDAMAQYPGASFTGSGGYHHHLAGNVWNSRGAGRRAHAAGLGEVELRARPEPFARLAQLWGGNRTEDPWGTVFTLAAQ